METKVTVEILFFKILAQLKIAVNLSIFYNYVEHIIQCSKFVNFWFGLVWFGLNIFYCNMITKRSGTSSKNLDHVLPIYMIVNNNINAN
jgi:hypothetical protein